MKKNIRIVLLMVLVTPFFSGVSLAILTPVADGHYHEQVECCCGDCWYGTTGIANGIEVRYYVDGMYCGPFCYDDEVYYLKTGIIEFNILSKKGLSSRGEMEALLSLTVKAGDLSSDGCLRIYNMRDVKEDGIIAVEDRVREELIGEICEDLQPGDIITLDVTSALEHDLFDSDQTAFSGFLIYERFYGYDSIEFYDRTDPVNAPKLRIIGDCEGDFDCDEDVDGTDASTFKLYFGRSQLFYPCDEVNPCRGDFDCDHDCDGTDAAKFKEDFGRSGFNNPCPVCAVGDWCSYP